jgi:hypothetical protein
LEAAFAEAAAAMLTAETPKNFLRLTPPATFRLLIVAPVYHTGPVM